MTHEIVPLEKAEEKFAIDDVLGTGWQLTLKKFWPLFWILGVNGLVAMLVPLASFVMGYGGANGLAIQLLMGTLNAAVALTIEIGMMNVYLMSLDGEKVNADDCFKCVKYLPSFFVAIFLSRILIVLGYLSFIIPGIILHISFQFAGYFIIEKKMGPIAALKASWQICDGARMQLFLLAIVSYFITIFGWMCFLVGAIPAYFINSLTNAATYRTLLANTPALAELVPPAQLSEEAVAELLKHDSWPDELKPSAAGSETAKRPPEVTEGPSDAAAAGAETKAAVPNPESANAESSSESQAIDIAQTEKPPDKTPS